MFLNRLNSEEKEAFLSLSVHAAEANGIIAEEERALIEEYCKEMGIAFFDADHVQPLDEVLAVYKGSEMSSKKIALLEILGLVYADGIYDKTEKQFISDFAAKVGLDQETVEKQTRLVMKYLELLKELSDSVF